MRLYNNGVKRPRTNTSRLKAVVVTGLLASTLTCSLAGQATGKPDVVTKMPGLIAFWTFGEEAGRPRLSQGTQAKFPLVEVGGPIRRVEGGSFSGYSAEFNGSQYLKIPHAETGDLNISGPNAQVSMFAVVRIVDLNKSRTIAGMWSEGQGSGDDSGTRQYSLLMNMPMYGGPRRLTPHISSEGGVTRRADGSAFPWCVDYAATASEVPEERWVTLGFTYDSRTIRAYIDGRLDAWDGTNGCTARTDRYFTSEGPNGGTRGMNPYFHGRGIFTYDPKKHVSTKPMGGSDFTVASRFALGNEFPEATTGRFAGLAVFNRALSDSEMLALHQAANLTAIRDSLRHP
jgi:hypothetical protein